MSKDHFYFSRNDRTVALILLFIIISVNLVRIPYRRLPPENVTDSETDTIVVEKRVGRSRADSMRSDLHKQDYSHSTVRYRNNTKSYKRDSIRNKTISVDTVRTNLFAVKKRPVSALDLNTADSCQLIELPGIGPYYASRILRMRNQLGGFILTSQLSDIDGLPDSVMEWFVITDTVELRRIPLNRATLAELRRHPYIDFYQARAIIEFRKERGNIKGPEQLSFMEEFTAQDLERLLPYLDFR